MTSFSEGIKEVFYDIIEDKKVVALALFLILIVILIILGIDKVENALQNASHFP